MKRRSARAKIIAALLRDINGDSPFTQPPLKVVEVWLQVADKQRRLAGRGYDGRVVRTEGQLDVVREWEHVVDIQTEDDRGDQSLLSYPNPHASTRWRGRMEGRFERPIPEVGWDGMPGTLRYAVYIRKGVGVDWFSAWGQPIWLMQREVSRKEESVPKCSERSCWTAWPLKMRRTRCPETSVRNYHSSPRKVPKERRTYYYSIWANWRTTICYWTYAVKQTGL